jgi:O-antigen chain-terminating methyltransferase
MTDQELSDAIRQVQERARARVPQGPLGLEGVTAADLMPLVHARDAAESKVAAIGTVNPRPPGFKNDLIQGFKRRIARALEWFIRDQVEFNRASMVCVQATLEALTEASRGIAALAAHHTELRKQLEDYHREALELKDIRQHWPEWRTGFEERRNASEIHMLRTISELQGAFSHRVTLLEDSFRKLVAQTHTEFTGRLAENTQDVQQRLWNDLQKVRAEYDSLIHTELRLIRQKPVTAVTTVAQVGAAPIEPPLEIDWTRFAETFRGSETRIRAEHQRYAAKFRGAPGEILDIGCGRGEFLECAREAGVAARGIDSNEECVSQCRAKGFTAERTDLFEHLTSLSDRSLGGVFCSQVIEHLLPSQLPRLVRLIAAKLKPGALVIFETPNPESLAIFATHFYIDPTHTRPVPPVLLRFYCEEAGMGGIEIERLSPAVESMPELADLPASVREKFFGALDYALIARKL